MQNADNVPFGAIPYLRRSVFWILHSELRAVEAFISLRELVRSRSAFTLLLLIGEVAMMNVKRRILDSEEGAIGYILAWFMGVPAIVLFAIFLLRGCN
jgi:hypothetical protein